jgi:hypothetical protein
VRLLLDEMWTPTIALELRKRGFDVIAISEPARTFAAPRPFLPDRDAHLQRPDRDRRGVREHPGRRLRRGFFPALGIDLGIGL